MQFYLPDLDRYLSSMVLEGMDVSSREPHIQCDVRRTASFYFGLVLSLCQLNDNVSFASAFK